MSNFTRIPEINKTAWNSLRAKLKLRASQIMLLDYGVDCLYTKDFNIKKLKCDYIQRGNSNNFDVVLNDGVVDLLISNAEKAQLTIQIVVVKDVK